MVFGFDGVIDTNREIISERRNSDTYTTMRSLREFRENIDNTLASRSSMTEEWITTGKRIGGHVPHLSRAFGKLGLTVIAVGTFGHPPRKEFVKDIGEHTLISVGEPSFCDAVEFDTEKLLLVEPGDSVNLSWEQMSKVVSTERLTGYIDGADVLSTGYWALIPDLPRVLHNLVEQRWNRMEDPPKAIFIDTGDIRGLSEAEASEGAELISTVNEQVPVILSGNRSEIEELAYVLAGTSTTDLERATQEAFSVLEINQVVGHGIDKSVAVTDEETSTVAVPMTESPAMTTSAGDHFNAGFVLGLIQNLPVPARVVLGNAVAGCFVRTGTAPTYTEIKKFVDGYAGHFDESVQ